MSAETDVPSSNITLSEVIESATKPVGGEFEAAFTEYKVAKTNTREAQSQMDRIRRDIEQGARTYEDQKKLLEKAFHENQQKLHASLEDSKVELERARRRERHLSETLPELLQKVIVGG